jgi:putative Mg2+ transporter-C (MgtC) family protein
VPASSPGANRRGASVHRVRDGPGGDADRGSGTRGRIDFLERARRLFDAAPFDMSISAQIGATLAREFALPDAATATVVAVRLLLAAALGGLLGLERERKGRAAGVKTHTLVSLGSALFVLAPLLAGIDPGDVTRVMQGIVSGIGFLGAGAIIKLGTDERIKGLTTAAGIWTTSAIGMAVGMGLQLAALVATFVSLLVFWTVPRLMHGSARREP